MGNALQVAPPEKLLSCMWGVQELPEPGYIDTKQPGHVSIVGRYCGDIRYRVGDMFRHADGRTYLVRAIYTGDVLRARDSVGYSVTHLNTGELLLVQLVHVAIGGALVLTNSWEGIDLRGIRRGDVLDKIDVGAPGGNYSADGMYIDLRSAHRPRVLSPAEVATPSTMRALFFTAAPPLDALRADGACEMLDLINFSDNALALAECQHPRLGAGSAVRVLDRELLRCVAKMACKKTPRSGARAPRGVRWSITLWP